MESCEQVDEMPSCQPSGKSLALGPAAEQMVDVVHLLIAYSPGSRAGARGEWRLPSADLLFSFICLSRNSKTHSAGEQT